MDRLRVEAPDERVALALVAALHGQHAEITPDGADGCEVVVELVANPERAVVEVLNVVDRWLAETQLGETRVILDGRSYTLPSKHAPRRSSG